MTPPTHGPGPIPMASGGPGLALLGATVRAEARGGVARVILEQRFANRHAESLTVVYRMPLPHGAAISGYVFRIGERRVVGVVDRRAQARELFEQALVEGKSAGLFEEERGSLFTQEIGNIPPGAEVVVELAVDQPLSWIDDEGAWEWRFPTTAAPRYLAAPGVVPDADRVALDVAEALEPRVALDLRIRDDLPGGRSVESPSHALVPMGVRGETRAALREGAVRMDRDLVVRWPVALPLVGLGVDVERAGGGPTAEAAFALITVMPPAPRPGAGPRALARDVIVLLDTSGSMAGRPLEQARRVVAALVDGLHEGDRLELIQFATTSQRWRDEAVPATSEAKRDALAWLAALQASGGTEMRAGIEAALAPLRPESQRQVVLLTDGLIGFESEVVAGILAQLPASSRLHTIGVGSAVNRSLTGPAARAGRGVEVVIGLDEDPERAARRLLSRTRAPLVVDLAVGGAALLAALPERLPDLFAAAPALIATKLRPEGGEVVVRGRTPDGVWEQRVVVPPVPLGTGTPGIAKRFAREAVLDLEMFLAAGAARSDIDPRIERLGLEFQISTRLTSWIAVQHEASADPAVPSRREHIPLELPFGISAQGLGLRPAVARADSPEARPSLVEDMRAPRPRPASTSLEEIDEKTRVTALIVPMPPPASTMTDCLVVIYTKEQTMLGKRFVLDESPTRVGRGQDNHVVLDFDSVSRRHAHFERRGTRWAIVDDGSTNGTYRNDEHIGRESTLENGDRVKIGPTIFKFLSGADVEAQYHEEIYRMTIIDGLTQIHNKRYFHEALEREALRSRRHDRHLSLLMLDVDHFKQVNDNHGHLAGDFMLKELARIISTRIRRDEVFARYGGEEFGIVLPETTLEGAVALAETLRQRAAEHEFVFQGEHIRITISAGAAVLTDADASGSDLVKRADERLYAAKKTGRNRVCS